LFADEERVLISALQHYLFCPRQCALIHVEGAWAENYLTASGRILHERTDSGFRETRGDMHRATSLRLFSSRLGLTGVADVVEYFRVNGLLDRDGTSCAVQLPGLQGWWRPFPVEYKRGKPKEHRADEVQLCAQALCMEEMHSVRIDAGALFYGETRRRVDVSFDSSLRELTEETVASVRQLLRNGETPRAIRHKGCDACSLVEVCCPAQGATGVSVRAWLDCRVRDMLGVVK